MKTFKNEISSSSENLSLNKESQNSATDFVEDFITSALCVPNDASKFLTTAELYTAYVSYANDCIDYGCTGIICSRSSFRKRLKELLPDILPTRFREWGPNSFRQTIEGFRNICFKRHLF